MARILIIDRQQDEISKEIVRAFQSGHINFLIGSGASQPAIATSGNIEKEIDSLFKGNKNNEAHRKIYDFLSSLQIPNNSLINGGSLIRNVDEGDDVFEKRKEPFELTKKNYRSLLRNLERILIDRKSSLLSKQANLFTTNYDLFVEEASKDLPALRLNDGFVRSPSLSNHFGFSPQAFFNTLFNRGNLYDYQVEIPSINLVKIHGSLSWKREKGEVVFEALQRQALKSDATHDDIEQYNKAHSLILPQQGKYREALLDRIYYDLLRIYSNELERENALLVAVGFSFDDEHICEITKRALKNPTLLLIISAFDEAAAASYSSKFDGYSNVVILSPGSEATLSLAEFNKFICDVFKVRMENPNER